MLAGHLEGEPRPDCVQRIGESDGRDAGAGASDEFVGVLDVVRVGGNDGAQVLFCLLCVSVSCVAEVAKIDLCV